MLIYSAHRACALRRGRVGDWLVSFAKFCCVLFCLCVACGVVSLLHRLLNFCACVMFCQPWFNTSDVLWDVCVDWVVYLLLRLVLLLSALWLLLLLLLLERLASAGNLKFSMDSAG